MNKHRSFRRSDHIVLYGERELSSFYCDDDYRYTNICSIDEVKFIYSNDGIVLFASRTSLLPPFPFPRLPLLFIILLAVFVYASFPLLHNRTI